MAELDLAAIKKLAEAATPGPWEKWHGNPEVYCQVKANERGRIKGYSIATCEADDLPELEEQYLEEDSYEMQAEANADFIAAANPETILRLVARCEAAEAERKFLADRLKTIARGEIRQGEMVSNAKDALAALAGQEGT